MATQLPLFDLDSLEAQCPRCGFRDRMAAFALHKREVLLSHPVIQALPGPCRTFLREAPDGFIFGATVGVSTFEHSTTYTKSSAFKHLHRLMRLGLVEAIPKRPGGVYHHYRLLFPNGAK